VINLLALAGGLSLWIVFMNYRTLIVAVAPIAVRLVVPFASAEPKAYDTVFYKGKAAGRKIVFKFCHGHVEASNVKITESASGKTSRFYDGLVPIVTMMPVVTVVTMPAGPIIRPIVVPPIVRPVIAVRVRVTVWVIPVVPRPEPNRKVHLRIGTRG
jgi:hypothetical protein